MSDAQKLAATDTIKQLEYSKKKIAVLDARIKSQKQYVSNLQKDNAVTTQNIELLKARQAEYIKISDLQLQLSQAAMQEGINKFGKYNLQLVKQYKQQLQDQINIYTEYLSQLSQQNSSYAERFQIYKKIAELQSNIRDIDKKVKVETD